MRVSIEISTEGGHVLLKLRNTTRSLSEFFWPTLNEHIAHALPHAHVEIEKVTVSERKPHEQTKTP